MSWETIGIIATLTAAFAALCSSIISGFMLRHQKKTFEKSLEPLVVPKVEDYSYTYKHGSPHFYKIDWGRSEEQIIKLTPSSYKNTKLVLENLGRGLAKNIEAKIKIINYEEVVQSINENTKKMRDDEELKLYIIKDSFLENTQSLRVEYSCNATESFSTYPLNNFKPQQFIYLVGEDRNSDIGITIPSSFMALYNLCLHTNSLSLEPKKRVFPILEIKIICQDGINNPFEFNYLYHYSFLNTRIFRNDKEEALINVNWRFMLKENN